MILLMISRRHEYRVIFRRDRTCEEGLEERRGKRRSGVEPKQHRVALINSKATARASMPRFERHRVSSCGPRLLVGRQESIEGCGGIKEESEVALASLSSACHSRYHKVVLRLLHRFSSYKSPVSSCPESSNPSLRSFPSFISKGSGRLALARSLDTEATGRLLSSTRSTGTHSKAVA